ncbi:hypothetical protein Tco_0933273 [Tanacetum coccineum]
MRPPGFNQPNPQASRPNQGYDANQGYNGNRNVNQTSQVNLGANSGLSQQAQAYQVPSTPAPVTYSRFEAYTKANDATLNNLQKNLNDFKKEQQDFQNEQRNFQNMMLNMFQKQMGNNNTSSSGTLPKDALFYLSAFVSQKMLKSLLSNKEKLNEMANTPVSETCSAIILKKLPEKLGDPGQFLIPCNFSELKLQSLSDLELDKEILIPIPRESKIGKDCDFPFCDDFQSFKTFSNPLFEKKDDFPSRNDESILKEEVHKETLKSYLNPLFEDDEENISIELSQPMSLEKVLHFEKEFILIKDKNDKKKQKQSKTDKKREKDKDKSKSEESAKDHSRISPTQQERQSKEETIKSRVKSDKISKFEGLLGSFEVKGLYLPNEES